MASWTNLFRVSPTIPFSKIPIFILSLSLNRWQNPIVPGTVLPGRAFLPGRQE